MFHLHHRPKRELNSVDSQPIHSNAKRKPAVDRLDVGALYPGSTPGESTREEFPGPFTIRQSESPSNERIPAGGNAGCSAISTSALQTVNETVNPWPATPPAVQWTTPVPSSFASWYEGVLSYGMVGGMFGVVMIRSFVGALTSAIGIGLLTALILTASLGMSNILTWAIEGVPKLRLALLGAISGAAGRSSLVPPVIP